MGNAGFLSSTVVVMVQPWLCSERAAPHHKHPDLWVLWGLKILFFFFFEGGGGVWGLGFRV